jgi:hypothetical protein
MISPDRWQELVYQVEFSVVCSLEPLQLLEVSQQLRPFVAQLEAFWFSAPVQKILSDEHPEVRLKESVIQVSPVHDARLSGTFSGGFKHIGRDLQAVPPLDWIVLGRPTLASVPAACPGNNQRESVLTRGCITAEISFHRAASSPGRRCNSYRSATCAPPHFPMKLQPPSMPRRAQPLE